ncbi:MAG: hypothetical protein ACRYGP_19090 [Janthinobacterium lividum]
MAYSEHYPTLVYLLFLSIINVDRKFDDDSASPRRRGICADQPT